MSAGWLWLILAAAVVTYATRVAGFAIGDRAVPPPARAFLGFVPIAAFAALAAPDIAAGGSETAPRLLGAAAAAVVVLRFGTLWPCLVVGMAVYWLARWLT